MNLEKLNKYRNKTGLLPSRENDNFGLFFIPYNLKRPALKVMCAPMTSKWQHVSVSLPYRCPTWEEMCFIKDLFWDKSETVVQFHPKESDYVNIHKYCLHMWRKRDEEYSLPPEIYV